MSERLYYSREAQLRAQQRTMVLVLLVAVGSLTVGTLLALLFAPQSGEEIRSSLGEQLDNAYSAGRHFAGQVGKEVSERIQDARG